jgi:hypothetical protein
MSSLDLVQPSGPLTEVRNGSVPTLRVVDALLRCIIIASLVPCFLFIFSGVYHTTVADMHGHARVIAAIAGASIFLIVVMFGTFTLINFRWTSYSFAYRSAKAHMLPIDWGQARWAPLRRALQDAAGSELPAFSVFSTRANLAVVHLPHAVGGVSGRIGEWGFRHQKEMMVVGAISGVLLGICNELYPGWHDSPAFLWALGVFITPPGN